MSLNNLIKKVFTYAGVYTAGVIISTSFVLSVNDLFYNSVFKELYFNGNKSKVWEEIKPREIFVKGAKHTFIKHQLEEDRDEDTKRYYAYIEKKKKLEDGGLDKDKLLYENIFENKNSSNSNKL